MSRRKWMMIGLLAAPFVYPKVKSRYDKRKLRKDYEQAHRENYLRNSIAHTL
ncbi:MAG TPA: hypothetical protein VEY51_02135 [Chondromyces sp.]|nr:hypothetical protein [Chondromyces sp.]